MVRQLFFYISIISLILIAVISPFWPSMLYFLIIVIPYIALGIYDLRHSHNVLRLYPVIGHLRYMFEFIRPEIQQYFVATNLSGRPYNREMRTLVYMRAKGVEDTHPFGTEHDLDQNDYEFSLHSLSVKRISEEHSRVEVGGPECKKPYNASRLNVSAMSFGSLSSTAVLAMNLGAKLGNFAQDTGEGGLTPYHLRYGGDIIWELGTAYFGCRTLEGEFNEELFVKKALLDNVKMVEIKLSQGAKPSHGGVLPAAKISREIAEIRGIPMGRDCISPPTHSTFSTPKELMQFIVRLRKLTEGKPIGFKLCIGKRSEFMGICKAMLETGVTPDFITVDGAEGGTGAAPLEFSNRLGAPINEGLAFVHNCLVGINLRDKMRIIASGKIVTGFDMMTKIALGADMVNMARPMMFAVGCIQALRCNTNTCPTGVTTQDPRRTKAIVVKEKCHHVKNLHNATIKSFLSLVGAIGIDHPNHLKPEHIHVRRLEGHDVNYAKVFHYIEPGNLLSDNIHPFYKENWEQSSADRF